MKGHSCNLAPIKCGKKSIDTCASHSAPTRSSTSYINTTFSLSSRPLTHAIAIAIAIAKFQRLGTRSILSHSLAKVPDFSFIQQYCQIFVSFILLSCSLIFWFMHSFSHSLLPDSFFHSLFFRICAEINNVLLLRLIYSSRFFIFVSMQPFKRAS